MNIKRYKMLRYVLIILLMLTPVRGVMAMPSAHCEMDDMAVTSSAESMHQNHAMHMTQAVADGFTVKQQSENDHQCCCCDDNSCSSNCDLGMAVSLLLQESSYVPVFLDISKTVIISADLLIRELTPPSRPPAKFS